MSICGSIYNAAPCMHAWLRKILCGLVFCANSQLAGSFSETDYVLGNPADCEFAHNSSPHHMIISHSHDAALCCLPRSPHA